MASTVGREPRRPGALVLGVAPHARRGGERPRRRAPTETVGHRGLHESGGVLGEPSTFGEVFEVWERLAVPHLGHRDPHQGRQLYDLGGRPGPRPRVDHRFELRAVQRAVRAAREALVAVPVVASDHRAEVEPLLPGGRLERDVAVSGGVQVGELRRTHRAERLARHLEPGHREERLAEHQRIEGGDVDQVADPLGAGPSQRGQRADGAVCAGGPVARLSPAEERRPVGGPALHVAAAESLAGEVGRRPVAPRPVEPERAEGHDHGARVVAMQRRRGEARVAGDRAPRRPDHDLGVGHQRAHQLDVAIDPGSRDHAVLRGREEPEARAVLPWRQLRPGLRPPAQRIALRFLDLRDIGAAVGEQLGAVRAGQTGGEIDDPRAHERPARPSFHPGTVGHRTPPRRGPAPSPPVRAGCGVPGMRCWGSVTLIALRRAGQGKRTAGDQSKGEVVT